MPGAGRFIDGPRVHFLDNLDPITFDHILHKLPLSSTRFVSISKSGGTGETLMQTIAVLVRSESRMRSHPADTFSVFPSPGHGRQERPARSARARGRALPRPQPRRRRPLLRC